MTLPKKFLDCHHHFVDTTNNKFQSFLGSLVPNEIAVSEHYERDVVTPLKEAGVDIVGTVHVEAMPDDGKEEVAWVDSLTSKVVSIVGSCDLSKPTADEDLRMLKKASPKVRGVRWILDCVGKFEPNTATHVATSRHDGIDYLRGSNGGYDGEVVPDFERGFALLEKHGLSFDLQCAPVQLEQAAKLVARYPNIKVCIDHLGKPRTLLGPDEESNTNKEPNESEIKVWREGMRQMAMLPNVYVKISMLGYIVPGWIKTPEQTNLVRSLAQEIVELFGPNRCMVATNWWKSAAVADADGLSGIGPSPVEFVTCINDFLSGYSDEDRDRMFCGTAAEFYKIQL